MKSVRRLGSALVPRGLASDPTIAGGQAGLAPPVVTAPLQSVLELNLPNELRKVVVGAERMALPPGELWKHYSSQVQSAQGDPGVIMDAVRSYMRTEDNVDVRFIVTALAELGSSFDMNSFWATGDKQIVTGNKYFKYMIADLIEGVDSLNPASAPLVLYSLANLEYRPARLMPALLGVVRSDLSRWSLEILANLAWSLASLNVDDETIVHDILLEAAVRFGQSPRSGSLHDWSQLAFACAMKGEYSPEFGCQLFLQNACSRIKTSAQLDRSGWAQFWIYQTLYSVDVERPASAAAIQQAVPMWIQERINFRWLDGILTNCQPQGADLLQLDVDGALKRTNTQALINCSAGRDSDEHHCWFVGHKLNPKIAIEYNSSLPTLERKFRPSGWTDMKSRILRKAGYAVAVIHKQNWEKLTQQQKEAQILLLRAKLGYIHDSALESQRPSQAVPRKRGEAVKTLKEGAVKWEDQPDWEPHMREPELEFTVHGYRPKGETDFKGGVRVNHRRKHIANGNHNWINSLSTKG